MTFSVKLLVLFCMMFCHVVDDYYLQGILANMKQQSWWKKNVPNKMYEHDFIVALIVHAFSWSFMISVPVFFVNKNYIFICFMIIVNMFLHALIDDLKSNKRKINLIQDQVTHFFQILVTWGVLVAVA